MKKHFFLLLIAASVSLSFNLNPKAIADENQTAFVDQTSTPEAFAGVEKIELDRNTVSLPCPTGMRPPAGKACDDASNVKVKTFAANPKKSELVYNYTVSGGRIIGRGAEVVWDLSGVRAGTYTITAAVDDGAGVFGKTQTATVEVKECGCRFVDACPKIKISVPNDPVKAGESVEFTAEIAGIPAENVTFNWTVSAGEIAEGQGTPRIKVKTTREMAEMNLTAALEISSDRFAPFCETSASETVSITK